MKWMFLPLKRYADFDGRSRRLEYWMFQLFIWIVIGVPVIATIAMTDMSGASEYDGGEASPFIGLPLVFVGLFYLAMIVPMIAVTVRRLHDRDMSGWFFLINFVP
jgi:uncharacterized membrane protein YhaH (DUF805 family)